MCFCDMHVDESSYFWSAKKVANSTSSDLEAFVTLAGGESSGEAAQENAGDPVDRFKGRFKEYASAVDEVVANNEQSMLPIFDSPVVQEATLESAQIQSLAELGADKGLGGRSPFEDG